MDPWLLKSSDSPVCPVALKPYLHGLGASAAETLLAPAAKQLPALPTDQPGNGHG